MIKNIYFRLCTDEGVVFVIIEKEAAIDSDGEGENAFAIESTYTDIRGINGR